MRKRGDYNFFAAHAWYVPGVGGMFALLGWFLVGALLGNVLQLVLLQFYSAETVMHQGMMLIYPVQFVPALMYAGLKSRRNMLFDQGYQLDSTGHHTPWGPAGVTALTALAALATILLADIPNYWNYRLTLRLPRLHLLYEQFMAGMEALTGGPFWPTFLTVAILAPLFEEWLCRGMVLRGLLLRMKPGWAILLSAVFFAVIHANPWQALNALLIGLFMGYVYYKTGSLRLTMLIHFLNNGLSVVASHIDALKDYDYFRDMIPHPAYEMVVAVSMVCLAVSLYLLSKIPLAHPWGNIDPAEA